MFLKIVAVNRKSQKSGAHTTIIEIGRLYSSPIDEEGKIQLEFSQWRDGQNDHEMLYVDAGSTQVYLMNDQGSTIDTIC